ncbi:YebC/PmpR family DNA-binding transcriptional regulator [Candidatus Roizmanbacteria bacterium]|nr:YebC/PmpR family DNA-binding transcriptional regulator [Candidatus Roizmanbacteria bacterium]
MSGHSKWANIKRNKEANDKVKGNIFAKLSRAIILSVSEGGGIPDPDLNVQLRLAVEKAKQYNMPKENIQRAIEKASGPEKTMLKEVQYEAFGPGGTALLILAATDNGNRTFSEVRNTVEMNGGKMGGQGAVNYLFVKGAAIQFGREVNQEEDVFVFAEQGHALDFDEDEEFYYVFLPFQELGKLKETSHLKGNAPEIEFRPSTYLSLSSEDSEKLQKLIGAIEDLDDVQNVFTNAEL